MPPFLAKRSRELQNQVVATPSATDDLRITTLPSFTSLLERVVRQGSNLSIREKVYLVSRIMEHSLEDGFGAAKKFDLTLKEKLAALMADKVEAKHKDALDRISKALGYHVEHISPERFRMYLEAYKHSNKVTALPPSGFLSAKATKLQAEIDRYYLNFLKQRKLAPEVNTEPALSPGEELATAHIYSASKALQQSYYTGNIRDIIWEATHQKDQNGLKFAAQGHYSKRLCYKELDFERYFDKIKRHSEKLEQASERQAVLKEYFGKAWRNAELLLSPPLINKANLKLVLNELRLDIEGRFDKALSAAQYKPTSLVFTAREDFAKELLVKELKASLVARGYEEEKITIEIHQESGEYRVFYQDGDNKVVFHEPYILGKKELRLEPLLDLSHRTRAELDINKYQLNDFRLQEAIDVGHCVVLIVSKPDSNEGLVLVQRGVSFEAIRLPASLTLDVQQVYRSGDSLIVKGRTEQGAVLYDLTHRSMSNVYEKCEFAASVKEFAAFQCTTAYGEVVVVPQDGRFFESMKFAELKTVSTGNEKIYFLGRRHGEVDQSLVTLDRMVGKAHSSAIGNYKTLFRETYKGYPVTVSEHNGRSIVSYHREDQSVECGPYDAVSQVNITKDEITFVAYDHKTGSEKIVAIHESNFGPIASNSYKNVQKDSSRPSVNTWVAEQSPKNAFVVTFDGRVFNEELSGSRDSFESALQVEDRLLFVTQDHAACILDKESRDVLFDKGPFASMIKYGVLGGRPVFLAQDMTGLPMLLFETAASFHQMLGFKDIELRRGDKNYSFIAAIGTNPGDTQQLILSWSDGLATSPKYQVINAVIEVNGQVIFAAKPVDSNKYYIFDCEGKPLSKAFDNIFRLEVKNDYLLITGRIGDRFIVDRYPLHVETRELTCKEAQKLRLLNLIQNPDVDAIETHLLGPHRKVDRCDKEHVRDRGALSATYVGALNPLLHAHPEYFLESNLAAKSSAKLDSSEIEKLLCMLYPEISANEEVASRSKKGIFSTLIGRLWRRTEQTVENCISNRKTAEFRGDDPRGKKGEDLILFKDKIPDFIMTGAYDSYDHKAMAWRKSIIHFCPELKDPIQDYTFTLPALGGLEEVNLPRIVGSTIIPDRIRGIDKQGNERILKIEEGEGGDIVAYVASDIKRIVYSQTRSILPIVPSDIKHSDYERFKRGVIRQHGAEIVAPLCTLPAECKVFLDGIKSLAPKAKLIAIEEFVRKIGYYDLDNKDIEEEKKGVDIETRISIMGKRLDEIREQHPKLREALADKYFAGVCTDFAILTAALAREAGFVAGVLRGFRPASSHIRVGDGHLCAFAAWPDEKGASRIIPVDGTPSSLSQAGGIQVELTLRGREVAAKKEVELQKSKLTERIEELNKKVHAVDVASLGGLVNGELEGLLNGMLQYEITAKHVLELEHVFGASRYAVFKPWQNSDDLPVLKEALQRRMQGSIYSNSSVSDLENKPAGSEFLKVVKHYIEAAVKSKDVSSREEAFDRFEEILDISKESLSETAYRGASMAVSYLRAKFISAKR